MESRTCDSGDERSTLFTGRANYLTAVMSKSAPAGTESVLASTLLEGLIKRVTDVDDSRPLKVDIFTPVCLATGYISIAHLRVSLGGCIDQVLFLLCDGAPFIRCTFDVERDEFDLINYANKAKPGLVEINWITKAAGET